MFSGNLTTESKTMLQVWRGKNEETFLRAQHSTVARLIPVLYLVVAIATIALSFVNSKSAPFWLSGGIPAIMMIPIVLRLRYWLGVNGKSETLPISKIRRDIRQTNYIGPVIALAFTAVGVALFSHGAAQQQAIIGMAIWILAITSAFCLAATPVASIAVLFCAAIPLAISFAIADNHFVKVMAAVVAVTTVQAAYVLIQNYVSFFEMVHSKAQLQLSKTAAEEAEKIASDLAHTDHLTKLPNRRHFEKMLQEHLEALISNGQNFSIGILDLDGFKPVNDVYGHSAGDEVLIEVATRLRQAVTGNCKVARLGGDEFAFISPADSDVFDLSAMTDNIQASLKQPYSINHGRTVRISSSIGIALHDGESIKPIRMIAKADIALYRSKSDGRAMVTIFTPEMEQASLERARIEQGLRKAISNNELEAFFQPIYELNGQKLVGFEALARWHDAELGQISPAIFIPIAEESGLIGPLTELMLQKAATAAAAWPDDIYLSFNVSAEQMIRESAGLRIIALLAQCGLSPNRFEIEVTETALMKDLPAARRTVENLKAVGVRISLDDFGTGYSSLSQIRDLPIDKVKIDKSFIDKICDDEKTRSLVATIITMCDALKLRCVAEGIEQPIQMDVLKNFGCYSGQGYYFAKPAPIAETEFLIGLHISGSQNPALQRRAS